MYRRSMFHRGVVGLLCAGLLAGCTAAPAPHPRMPAAAAASGHAGTPTRDLQTRPGSEWSLGNAGPLADSGYFTGLSAGGPGDVWALGISHDNEEDTGVRVILHGDGHAWTRIAGVPGCPKPTAIGSAGAGRAWIACGGGVYSYTGHAWRSVTDIVLPPSTVTDALVSVGDTTVLGGDRPSDHARTIWDVTTVLAVHRAGRWTTTSLGQGAVHAISGSSSADIWAVGGLRDARQPPKGQPFIAHYDGKAWSMPPFPTFQGELYGVYAASPNSAWAVGAEAESPVTVILHWDGTSWTRLAMSVRSFGHTITGTPGGDVWMGASDATEFLHFDGSAWTVETVTLPNGTDHGAFGALTAVPGTWKLVAAGHIGSGCDDDLSCLDGLVLTTG